MPVARSLVEELLVAEIHVGAAALGAQQDRDLRNAVREELEQRLAGFVGLPRSLLFSSGYLANLAAVTTLADSST